MKNSFSQFIQVNGMALSAINPGSSEFALPMDKALDALAVAKASNIRILGGDVLRRTGGRLEYTGMNWHCNSEAEESLNCHSSRSIQEAGRFLEKLTKIENDFMIVFVWNESDVL